MSPLDSFFSDLPKKSCHTYDIGNSHPHYGVFIDGHLTDVNPVSFEDINYESGIVCSVNKEVPSSPLYNDLKNGRFQNMPVSYTRTLGHDRLALGHLCFNMFQNEDVLLIDAGTFITLDFVSGDGFLGGHIVPGMKTLSTSFQNGNQLFEASFQESNITSKPQNTEQSINSGYNILLNGLTQEISKLAKNVDRVVLTGGQRSFLKNKINVNLEEDHLLHFALYFQYITSLSNL